MICSTRFPTVRPILTQYYHFNCIKFELYKILNLETNAIGISEVASLSLKVSWSQSFTLKSILVI